MEKNSQAVDRLVGVEVTDETLYQEYRKHMLPLLERVGGQFMVDVRVSEVLLAPNQQRFNRLFTIRFPNQEAMANFFSNPEYLAVKEKFFEPSVASTSPLAMYGVLP